MTKKKTLAAALIEGPPGKSSEVGTYAPVAN